MYLPLLAFVFDLYFHLCNGIRHLFWDVGLGFDIDVAYKTGYAVVAGTVVLTLLTLCLAAGGAA